MPVELSENSLQNLLYSSFWDVVGMSLDRQTASLLFAVALVGVPLSVEKEVPGQFFDGAVLLGRGAGRKGACEELPS